MDQEKCNLKAENSFLKGEIGSSVLDNSDEINCTVLPSDTNSFSCISSHDIYTSSLINSPLVYELLISHGLLDKKLVENNQNFSSDSDTKICSIEDNCTPPSFFSIDLFQSPTSWNYAEDNDKKDDYKCGWESCNMDFLCQEDLVQHINNTHICQDKNSLYMCNWNGCIRQGKAIYCKYRLLSHIRTHMHDKPHKCDVCEKEFSRVDHLKIHIRSHTGEKPYHCLVPGCNKAFTNTSDRHKHSKRHQNDKPFVCHVEGCNKRYTDPSSLRVHKRSHANGNIQNNSNSDSEDFNSSSLKRATKCTNAYKPYACKVEGCNKKYTDPSSLRVHKRSHAHGSVQNNSNSDSKDLNSSPLMKTTKFNNADKPYACKVEGCNKRYTDPSSLRKHKRSHIHDSVQNNSNSEDFNSSFLKRATKFSNADKPYACKVEGCNKRYTDPSSLRKHQRVTSHGRDANTFKDINRSI